MTNLIRKNYRSEYFNIPSEYWLIYEIDGMAGITRVYKSTDVHESRCYRVIQKDGTIIEAGDIRAIYNMRGNIARDEVEYTKEILKLV